MVREDQASYNQPKNKGFMAFSGKINDSVFTIRLQFYGATDDISLADRVLVKVFKTALSKTVT